MISSLAGSLTGDAAEGGSERARWDANPLAILAVGVQFLLVVAAVRSFDLESPAVHQMLKVGLAGFFVHAFLPRPLRLPFFTALSVVGIGMVMGVTSTLWLVGIGGLLMAVCHLPISFYAKAGVLLISGVALGVLRLDRFETPWSSAIWPVLASMFMFRLILYLRDLPKQGESVSPFWGLSYFFMLPNVCFPLFPVVDFVKFREGYYNEAPIAIYQRGVRWMMRGVIHLLIYRLVYQTMPLSPKEVVSSGSLALYFVGTFLLYLRISGQFHLIVGLLQLFGFNLPDTHRLYYLSSSFNDFWRRANIYWKDFMMSVVYYPAYFRLRKPMGGKRAMVVSTLLVFFVTWFLHAYQWYWLRGAWQFEWHDTLFWIIFALLVVVNSVISASNPTKRAIGKKGWSTWRMAGHVFRVIATFTVICLLWSMWSSQTLGEWISLWRLTGNTWIFAALLAPAAYALARLCESIDRRRGDRAKTIVFGGRESSLVRQGATCFVVLLALVGVGHWEIDQRVAPRLGSTVGGRLDVLGERLRDTGLNRRDSALVERGYYENLNSVNRFNSELWARYSKTPEGWANLRETDAMRVIDSFLLTELVPSVDLDSFKGHLLSTNALAMRDQEYDFVKAPGTFRIVLLGASHTLGSGVGQEEVFEAVVEERMNRELESPWERIEILNLSVPGYSFTRHALQLETQALALDPDLVLVFAHPSDQIKTVRHLGRIGVRDIDLPFPELQAILGTVLEGDDELVLQHRVEPLIDEIRDWSYRHMAQVGRETGIPVVWVYLEELLARVDETVTQRVWEQGSQAGFAAAWDLRDVYPTEERLSYQVAEWDDHPNAECHRMVADRLYALLAAWPALGVEDASI